MKRIKRFIKLNRHFFEALCVMLCLFLLIMILAAIGGADAKTIRTLITCYSIAAGIVLLRQLTFTPFKWRQ